MGCAENQESKPASFELASCSSVASVDACTWVDADFPHSPSSVETTSSPCVDTIRTCRSVMEVVETATAHDANTSAMHGGSSAPLDCPVACSASTKMHASLYSSAMRDSSLRGNAAAHAVRWSAPLHASLGIDVGHVMPPPPILSEAKVCPSRLEFMQSYVNTLLPELQRIHSQSLPVCLEEKFSAVRLAADMSLAISAGGNNAWSQALFQELSNSFTKEVGKDSGRHPSMRRRRIYAGILRRNTPRGGSNARCFPKHSRTSHCKGSFSNASLNALSNLNHATGSTSAKRFQACMIRRDLHSLSGGNVRAMHGRRSPNVHRMRRVVLKRHCERYSYVEILRKSRLGMKSNAKPRTDAGIEASGSHSVQSISRQQIARLGGLVPGGCNMDVPLLFQEAADYILSLQMQVEALQSLSNFV